jgi:hypothetical protein
LFVGNADHSGTCGGWERYSEGPAYREAGPACHSYGAQN